MRHVTFGVAMSPFGVGDKLLIPEPVADRLKAEGVLSANEAWPPAAAPAPSGPAARKPVRPILKPKRPAGSPDQRIAR
jgi:hypothetical protein